MRHLGRTRPFRDARGAIVSGSIAEIAWVNLGGVDQWVMIRGESLANPPLVLLHGGPGLTETTFFRRCNAALERLFTVVYWDQRGAGRSYDPSLPRSSMTVERFVADLDELVDHVRRRTGADKVAILGHSWGSALGAIYAARFPEKVAAYVGAAQAGDWAEAEALGYADALAEAQRQGDDKTLAKLRAIGPPPHTADQVFVERTCTARLDGMLRARMMWKTARLVLGRGESSIVDLPDALHGFRFTMEAMWPEVSKLNLLERVPALKMPTFFFLGRKDHWIPNEASVAYIEKLEAPSKTIVWFDQSGHEAFVDEAKKFNAVMRDLVRPVLAAHAPARAA